MIELQQLVRRYTAGQIDYRTFRQEFVRRFLAVQGSDVVLDTAVAEVESACVDAAEGQVDSEKDLRDVLAEIANSATVVSRPLLIASASPFSLSVRSGTSSTLQEWGAAAVMGRIEILPETVSVS
jgi:hypothetical protein